MPHKFGDHAPWSNLMNEQRRKVLPVDVVLRLLAPRPGSVVVEVGAGIGYITLPLALQVGPAGEVTATDIAEEALAQLSARVQAQGLSNVRVVKNEESRLPLPDAAADKALLVDVLHELENPGALLVEVHRVLRAGGDVLVVDWKPGAGEVGPPQHERLTVEDASRLLQSAGFDAEPLDYPHPSHYAFRGSKPAAG